jgi:ubiquitin-conjugating enzyme E2 S
MNGSIQINPRVINVIQKQISELVKRPPDSVRYVFNECDILDIQADIIGPIETPYTEGVFRCKLVLSSEFPRVPPKGYFLTKIFHPNVSDKGEICVNTLKKDWDPTNWSLQHIFEVIRSLLIVPFPESSLNEEAGKLFMEDYEEYAKHARLITELYALPKEKTVQSLSSPLEKPSTAMDISFENTQEDSPKKPFSGSMNTGIFTFDTQFVKQNSNDSSPFGMLFKAERPDDVLMTVTNSLNTNLLSPVDDSMFKKTGPAPFGNMMGTGMGGLQVNTNPKAAGNESISAKKENEKKWKKRI